MSKRVAVVTGGIGGLGSEICKYLARSGRKVIAADLASRSERVDAFRDEMKEFGDSIVFEACMDLVIGLTACSAGQSNNFSYKPIHYEIIDAG